MKIGLQIPDFTTPGGPARLGADLATMARTADDAGFEFLAVMDHFFQIRRSARPITRCSRPTPRSATWPPNTARAKLLTLVTGVTYRDPGHAREDHDHARRAVRRPGVARHRRGLERGGVARARHPVPAGRRAVRAAGGDAADLPADVARRRQPLPRQALPAGADAELAAAADQAAPADPHRRRRARRRRCAWWPSTPHACNLFARPRAGPQARRAAGALRGRGPRLRRDREDRLLRLRRRREGRERGPGRGPAQRAGRAGLPAPRSAGCANVWDITPLEVIGSEVIPAVAPL